MTQNELNEILVAHKAWLEGKPEGRKANLWKADLREANIDYSCWPLWCGSLSVKVEN